MGQLLQLILLILQQEGELHGAGVTPAACFSWKYSQQQEISPVPILWSTTEGQTSDI